MPIEFRCTQCQRLLRTADDTAGRQAKCPECGAILTIPTPAAPAMPPPGGPPAPGGAAPPTPPGPQSPFAARIPPPGAPSEPENPYQSPAAYAVEAPPAYAPVPGRFVPTRIDIGDVFGRAWTIFKGQWLICIGAVLIVGILQQAAAQVVNLASTLLGAAAEDEAVAFVLAVVGWFAVQLFGLWLRIGQWLLFLRIARGQEASLGELFRGGPYFITVLLAGLLWALAYLGGLILLIVPGIIFALMFSQFYYLILDRDVGVMESLSLSRQITEGNKLTLFAIYLLMIPLSIAGLLACCVGIVVVAGFFGVLHAVVYLAMTGQPTADQIYRQAYYPEGSGPAASPFADTTVPPPDQTGAHGMGLDQ